MLELVLPVTLKPDGAGKALSVGPGFKSPVKLTLVKLATFKAAPNAEDWLPLELAFAEAAMPIYTVVPIAIVCVATFVHVLPFEET